MLRKIAQSGTLVAAATIGVSQAGAAYLDVVLADSPTGYYRLGEGSGATAFNIGSGQSGNATYSTSTTQGQAGIPGGGSDTAVLFSGTGTTADKGGSVYLEPANAGATVDVYSANNTFTLEAWLKTTHDFVGDPGALVSVYRTSANNRYHFIGIDSSERAVMLGRDTSPVSASGTTALNDGNWHHVVGVFTTTTDTLYVDGVQVATMTGPAVTSGVVDLMIGRVNDDNDDEAPGHFRGVIDEVAIYNGVALSSTRILAHYNAGIPEPTSLSLIAIGGLVALRRRRTA